MNPNPRGDREMRGKRTRKNRTQATFFLLLLGFALLATGSSQEVKGQYSSTLAPEFALPDLEGNTVRLSDFEGKVIILDFWATWCPPCVQEMPHFVELYEKYRDDGFQMIGIALSSGSAKDIKKFTTEHGINYLILMGNREVARKYGGIRAIPTTFLIDRQRRILKRYIGYRPKEVFEKDLKTLF